MNDALHRSTSASPSVQGLWPPSRKTLIRASSAPVFIWPVSLLISLFCLASPPRCSMARFTHPSTHVYRLSPTPTVKACGPAVLHTVTITIPFSVCRIISENLFPCCSLHDAWHRCIFIRCAGPMPLSRWCATGALGLLPSSFLG